jgi:hypothetical protein
MGGWGGALWGKTLWGQSAQNFGGNPNVLDVQNSYFDVLYRLGFAGLSDIGPQSGVTPAVLFQFADDAAKRLAYEAGVLITLDSSITVHAGAAAYNLPATHVFTLMAALTGGNGGPQLLRLTPVRDLWALDADWGTTGGNPLRASFDAGAVGTVTLYPNPNAGGPWTLEQVCQEYAGTLAPGASTLPLPTVYQDYFSYQMLLGARFKESDARMEEMAQHFRARCQLYEQILEHLHGPGM